MKYNVNKDICIGCGLCTEIAKKTFVLDEDGFAKSFSEPKNKQEDEEAMLALNSCPVDAISKE